jgi:catechol 2,3-dioxygenase-like lactoylglutathione lyase family enzyme
MIQGFDRIVIEVPDLAAAMDDYRALLGDCARREGEALWPLANVTLALQENPARDRAAICGLVFIDDELEPGELQTVAGNTRGLALERSGGPRLDAPAAATSTGIAAVDHVVLMTSDADDCIACFGEGGLGLRLALDQMVPKWGGRMLFFRCGQLTLEVIHNLDDPPGSDFLWGVTYQCPDIERTIDALDATGCEHSGVRDGRKPGTRVATVKSRQLDIPTLLLEPALS